METEIKKWCTFGAFHRDYPSFIGFLEKGSETSGMIRYAENQLYPLECWDMNYVVVHESLDDAIVFLIKNNPEESIYTMKEYLHFPTAKKKVDWEYVENKLKQEKNEKRSKN